MKFPRVSTTNEKAFRMYNEYPYFQRKEVKELFNCSDTTASKIVKITKEEMQNQNIRIYTQNPNKVDKNVLYQMAGLDIAAITKNYNTLLKAKLL